MYLELKIEFEEDEQGKNNWNAINFKRSRASRLGDIVCVALHNT